MIWGPASPEASLRDRIARYISAPLSPVEVRELPCDVSFRACPEQWEIGSATDHRRLGRPPRPDPRLPDRRRAAPRSPTSPTTSRRSAPTSTTLEPEWISGFALAEGADLLIHDGQYADEEYPDHLGWGHSALSHSLAFARRTEARRTVLFHHDPLHSDAWLDAHGERAAAAWEARGGAPGAVELGARGTSSRSTRIPGNSPSPGPRECDRRPPGARRGR